MPPAARTRGRKRRRVQQDEDDDTASELAIELIPGNLPTPPRTRGRPRNQAQLAGDDDQTPGEVAFQVTREALDMLRETLANVEGLIKDACNGSPDNLRTLQLDAMSIHNDIMGLHVDMISAKASGANIEREAHFFQRRAFKLHQAVNKMQHQKLKPKAAATRVKSASPVFQLWCQLTNFCTTRLVPNPRRQTRDSDEAKQAIERAEMATQTEEEKKKLVETADLAIQTKDLELPFPEVSASLRAEAKVAKIPRFFLETLSSNRYEEFTVEEVAKAFKLGSRLAEFFQTDVFFRKDYSNIHGDLIGDLYNKYTQHEG
ncbi:hypothetical protein PG993_004456 [Apiospora rasikravindrae]|uniref:Uncharacterized protein n=1 Tax=Apiospora rasikravindrae TaxID=990691 RepID=A0ABR1TCV2_9PEZI